jgi:CheY-like chemotaxis protein
VLVVDSERASQRMLSGDLSRLGCETRVIEDVAELRSELCRHGGAPDLIAAEYGWPASGSRICSR